MKRSHSAKLFLYKDKQKPAVMANFNESIVDAVRVFNPTEATTSPNHSKVSYSWENGNLVIQSDPNGISLTRPSFCPITSLPDRNIIQNDSGVSVAASILLQSADDAVLITKRCPVMRSFPNVWVPPGGHVDPNETFKEAGLRELLEETGLDHNNQDHGMNVNCETLGFWESVFPPRLELGIPQRHHIVSYILCKSVLPSHVLSKFITLQPEETDAYAWICPCLAKKIVSTDCEFTPPQHIAQTCNSDSHVDSDQQKANGVFLCGNSHKKLEGKVISVKPLLNTEFNNFKGERVSTGTKYALNLWLKKLSAVNLHDFF